MKAVQIREFGGPEVLRVAELEDLHAGPGQIRIRVAAAGVNPADFKIRSGAMQTVFPIKLPAVPGIDAAGVVDEIGGDVTGVQIGDEVLGWADSGSYAEYALLAKFAKKPAPLSWEMAAALPVVGETAQRTLDAVHLRDGETVLIHAASGGVGSVAVQLAVMLGAVVIGTAGAENLNYVRSLGATPVLYGEGLVDRVRAIAPRGIDAVIDASGKNVLADSIALRGGVSRIVTIADPRAGEYGVEFSSGSPQARSAAGLQKLADLVADGKLTLAIAKTFPLADASRAHELSETGHPGGKIVLTVAS